MKQYYQMGSDETRMQINGSLESLSSEQVREHQKKYGPNEFRKRRRKASDDFSGAVQGFPCYHSDYLGNHLRFSRGCRKARR
mgnify:CR=1 FL=1